MGTPATAAPFTITLDNGVTVAFPATTVDVTMPAAPIEPPPVTGNPQFPDLLKKYPKRPSWQVAGVDFAVGPAAPPTKDWKTLSQSGVSVSGNRVTLSGSNITLDGVDFSLHGGATIVSSGSNNRLTNCKVFYGSAIQTEWNFISITGGTNFTVDNSILDGNGVGLSSSPQSTIMVINAGFKGKLSLLNNLIQNFVQHIIEFNANGAVVYKNNLLYNGGCAFPGPHLNYLQFGNNINTATGDSTATGDIQYNTSYQPTQPKAGGEGYQFYANGNGTVTGECAFNTMIYGPNGEGRLHFTSAASGTIHDNWFDKGSGIYWYADSNPQNVYSNNYDLPSGNKI